MGAVSGYDHTKTPGPGDALFFGRDLAPMSGQDFLRMLADPTYRFLAQDTVGSKTVITAWLGTNQWESDDGKRYIFGTIVHDTAAGAYTDERFSGSEDEALATHAATVQGLRA